MKLGLLADVRENEQNHQRQADEDKKEADTGNKFFGVHFVHAPILSLPF